MSRLGLGLGLNLPRPIFIGGGGLADFELTIKTDNAGGISNNDQFILGTISTGVYDFVVDWGDGSSDTITTFDDPALTHTYSTAGTYNLKISGNTYEYPYFFNGDDGKLVSIDNGGILSFGTSAISAFRNSINLTQISFINTTGVVQFTDTWRVCNSLTSFPLIDTSSGTNFTKAWYNCTSLTSFPLLDMSSGTNFTDTWRVCNSLTSFPLIDTSSGISFSNAWNGCVNLTSFPLLDVSSGTNFTKAWLSCANLTSFPLIDTSSGTDFTSTWNTCVSLTSFPLIDMSSGTNFDSTWNACANLTSFPLLDVSSGISFSNAWLNCALNSQSIDNVMQALVNGGKPNLSTNLSGGTNLGFANWSAGAIANYNTLISNGWTITTNP